jgi:hypothetical protein
MLPQGVPIENICTLSVLQPVPDIQLSSVAVTGLVQRVLGNSNDLHKQAWLQLPAEQCHMTYALACHSGGKSGTALSTYVVHCIHQKMFS